MNLQPEHLQQQQQQQQKELQPHNSNGTDAAEATTAAETHVYTCRMCRRALFTEREMMPHDPDPTCSGNKGFKQRGGTNCNNTSNNAAREVQPCTSYFLDPDVALWVAAESREVHRVSGGADVSPDTIYCPHRGCGAKIGTQSWVGSQCSCGAWVSPAFKIHGRAVDKMPLQQSVAG
ncbi:dual specificity phosphatase 12 [Trypanosoma grayi]|uniref:dual specificity phosphatase 12 n=1 Tax=Trypanosoma grayi TaxID=71804 RepID=UPI0004F41F43|nr:dual specificity phosphatase 12 [Trypanosoma grayi]KEG11357.1 dual specificity phosphatase 12 [Trypanosoma grayi]